MAETVFIAGAEGRFTATELSRGPWDPRAQHGGAPAALMMRAFERLASAEELVIARVSYEFLRPAPLGELRLETEVVRDGRRARLVEASLLDSEGGELVRARALQVHRADGGIPESPAAPPPGLPGQGQTDAPAGTDASVESFGSDAMEIRFVSGAFNQPGPATAWFRLRVPLVEGEEPSPLQRLAAAADFGNGISAALPWEQWVFINPDLTLYVDRPPTGQWICLDAQTNIARGGAGIADAVLYDQQGRVGRAVQALLIARR